jgi:hypothetical protein
MRASGPAPTIGFDLREAPDQNQEKNQKLKYAPIIGSAVCVNAFVDV